MYTSIVESSRLPVEGGGDLVCPEAFLLPGGDTHESHSVRVPLRGTAGGWRNGVKNAHVLDTFHPLKVALLFYVLAGATISRAMHAYVHRAES